MSDILRVECLSCGAQMSGVRTEFGSLVVPGRDSCPRCGATGFTEVGDEEASAGGDIEAEAAVGTDPQSASEGRVGSGTESETRE